jgi:membrane-associated protease RseP (regulator of RpoE activity)
MTLLVVIAGLVLLVFLHELGHFSVARAVGMKPRSFYIGFPPALVKVKRKGIEYGIGMIPLGGMVQLPGMQCASSRASFRRSARSGAVSRRRTTRQRGKRASSSNAR